MKMSGQWIPALVAIGAALSLGCASSYVPREPGRIHIVMTGGGRMLEKDGKFYGMSGFTSDPIEAVSGHPIAENHARTFVKRRKVSGFLMLLGVAGTAAGFALNTTEPGHMGQKIAARGTICASLLTALGAFILIVSPQPHLLDAINIYNDDVSRGKEGGLPTTRSPNCPGPGYGTWCGR